jgi:hypothetical protein
VNGCSCKEAEYLPAAADQKADAPAERGSTQAAGAGPGADVTTGSTGTQTSIDGWQTEASPQAE